MVYGVWYVFLGYVVWYGVGVWLWCMVCGYGEVGLSCMVVMVHMYACGYGACVCLWL